MKSLLRHLAAGLLLVPALLQAHGGEDHEHPPEPAPAVSSGDRAQRLSDGSVFLPKAVQRQLSVRTVVAATGRLPLTVQLNAHVVMNPNSGGRVQATQAGRLEGGPRGLPLPGQRVVKGELLARVQPTLDSVERGNRDAQLAELRAELPLVQQRVTRYRELEGSIPKKELQAAEAEARGLQQRIAALQGVTASAEALRAPVSGVIASARAVSGQVVSAGELLYEIIDPAALLVEALVYEPALARQLGPATISGQQGSLTPIGSGGALRAGALPVLFRANGVSGLALGQSLHITAQTGRMLEGIALPAAAVVRNQGNESTVWLHEAAERFRAHSVRVQIIDAERVAVQGITPGTRVVVSGATLLNQIR